MKFPLKKLVLHGYVEWTSNQFGLVNFCLDSIKLIGFNQTDWIQFNLLNPINLHTISGSGSTVVYPAQFLAVLKAFLFSYGCWFGLNLNLKIVNKIMFMLNAAIRYLVFSAKNPA